MAGGARLGVGAPAVWFLNARARSAYLLQSVGTGLEADVRSDRLMLLQVFAHNLTCHRGGDLAIPNVVGLHHEGAPIVTSAKATGTRRVHLRVEAALGEFPPQCDSDLIGSPLRAGVAVAEQYQPLAPAQIPRGHKVAGVK